MANRIKVTRQENFAVDFVANTMKNTACQFHQSYELCFFSAGHRTYMINDEIYDVPPNSVILIPPYTQHSTCGTAAATRTVIYFTVYFLNEYFSPGFVKDLLNEYSSPFCVFIQPNDNIDSLIKNIRNNHLENQTANAALNLALLLNAIKRARQLPRKEKNDNTQGVISRAISYIEKNLFSILSLKEIAHSLHISLSYLEASFKKNMGISMMQYIIKSRINYASNLLLTTKKNITEISTECGFNSSTHFSNTFKKHMGLSPREYRR